MGSARWRAAGIVTGAVTLGAVTGYLAERRLVHTWLERQALLGALPDPAGESHVLDGPDGVRLAVTRHIPAGGADGARRESARRPTLVLVHGWLCDQRVWALQVNELAQHHTVVTFDLPGHGSSTPPLSGRYDLDLLGDALNTVVAEASGSGPVVLAGHSLGGMTVLNAVGRHPALVADRLAGLVMLSTSSRAQIDDSPAAFGREASIGLSTLGRLEHTLAALMPALRRAGLAERAAQLRPATTDLFRVLVRAVGLGWPHPPRAAATAERMLADADPDVALGLAEAVAGLDEDPAVRAIAAAHVPLDVMVGTMDRLTPPNHAHHLSQLGAGRLVELDGAGHLLPIERPRAVNETLRRRLDDAVAFRSRPAGTRRLWSRSRG